MYPGIKFASIADVRIWLLNICPYIDEDHAKEIARRLRPHVEYGHWYEGEEYETISAQAAAIIKEMIEEGLIS